ncbi:hypothetical protein EWM64_g8722 [Hericium alpestre]|uniref:Uncharacterized protein n=1 Tax=Hericium alpestre TaxID=135208 RepID=A0A4Y9ZM01_9AGAM|nr:hypothetical protein EWM64_g8722 [Hericium alpestre]
MPTTLEVVHWPANEAYVKDNTILKPAGDVIARSPGLQKIWYGQQVEETRAYMAIGTSAPHTPLRTPPDHAISSLGLARRAHGSRRR